MPTTIVTIASKGAALSPTDFDNNMSNLKATADGAKADAAAASATAEAAAPLTSLATGFSIVGGTTPKTLTVDETAALSSKAPKANPVFTGDVKGSGAVFAAINPTVIGAHYVGGSQMVSLLDNQLFTFNLLQCAVFTVYDYTNNKGAVFFNDYTSGVVIKLADPNSAFEITNIDTGKIAIFTSSNNYTTTVKNYTNATIAITVNALGRISSAVAPV